MPSKVEIDVVADVASANRKLDALGRKMDGTADELRRTLGRDPSADEMAHAMGISLEEYHKARNQIATRVVDLESSYSDSNPAFTSEEPTAEAVLLDAADKAALAHAIAALPERLQLVIQLHFLEELNLTEIAAILDVSVPRVHQLKANALEKLRIGLTARESI